MQRTRRFNGETERRPLVRVYNKSVSVNGQEQPLDIRIMNLRGYLEVSIELIKAGGHGREIDQRYAVQINDQENFTELTELEREYGASQKFRAIMDSGLIQECLRDFTGRKNRTEENSDWRDEAMARNPNLDL